MIAACLWWQTSISAHRYFECEEVDLKIAGGFAEFSTIADTEGHKDRACLEIKQIQLGCGVSVWSRASSREHWKAGPGERWLERWEARGEARWFPGGWWCWLAGWASVWAARTTLLRKSLGRRGWTIPPSLMCPTLPSPASTESTEDITLTWIPAVRWGRERGLAHITVNRSPCL